MRLKCGTLGGELVNVSPEYDDCLARAREHGVPVKDVFAAAAAAAGELDQAELTDDTLDDGLQGPVS